MQDARSDLNVWCWPRQRQTPPNFAVQIIFIVATLVQRIFTATRTRWSTVAMSINLFLHIKQ